MSDWSLSSDRVLSDWLGVLGGLVWSGGVGEVRWLREVVRCVDEEVK